MNIEKRGSNNRNLYSEDDYEKARDLYQQGRDAMSKGLLEEACVLFQQSIKFRPHFKALELLGDCYMQMGLWKEAIIPLAAATTLNSGVRAPSLLSEAFLLLGEYEDAKDMVGIALKRDPKNRKTLHVNKILTNKT